MRVTFLPDGPEYRAGNLTVGFAARIDGENIDCAISAEALEDHFGAASLSASDLIGAFTRHRAAIENAAADLLTVMPTKRLLLRSGYFRAVSATRHDGART
jgi:hypothetical protein